MRSGDVSGVRERLLAHAEHDLEHLNTQILPWWYANGSDDVDGGVFTCFDNEGRRLSTDKYTWSQGRWAWVQGRIATESPSGCDIVGAERAAERAARTADFLLANAVLPDGSTAYQLDAAGVPIPQAEPAGALHTSVYADLFAVIGFAGAIAANSRVPGEAIAGPSTAGGAADPRCTSWADAARIVLLSASGRVRERQALTQPYPVPEGMSSLAEGMMMLNAASELFLATGSPESRAEAVHWAGVLIDAAERAAGALPADFAFIEPSGDRAPGGDDTLIARHRTPGHVLEMLWFLLDASEALPEVRDRLGGWVPALATRALELGWDASEGGLFRYVDVDGGPPVGELGGGDYEQLVVRTWSTKLWWPHAEALYATAALAAHYDDEGLLRWHERVREYTFAVFPADGQEWIQIRDRHGAPLDEVVALPVKDPFHIARALILMTQLGRTKGQQR